MLIKLGTQIRNDGLHMHVILFRDQIQDGRLPAILVVKKSDVEHVLNHFSDMQLRMLFKLGTQIRNDGLHMLVIFFNMILTQMHFYINCKDKYKWYLGL